jgi:hypothetical protein
VCYYESDVDDAVTILKDQLKLLEETNKTEELEKMIVNLAIKEHT